MIFLPFSIIYLNLNFLIVKVRIVYNHDVCALEKQNSAKHLLS